jgi:hypothetical protein
MLFFLPGFVIINSEKLFNQGKKQECLALFIEEIEDC